MNCPKCGSMQDSVVDSRPQEDGSIKRRRKCMACGDRFYTIEIQMEEYRLLKEEYRSSKEMKLKLLRWAEE